MTRSSGPGILLVMTVVAHAGLAACGSNGAAGRDVGTTDIVFPDPGRDPGADPSAADAGDRDGPPAQDAPADAPPALDAGQDPGTAPDEGPAADAGPGDEDPGPEEDAPPADPGAADDGPADTLPGDTLPADLAGDPGPDVPAIPGLRIAEVMWLPRHGDARTAQYVEIVNPTPWSVSLAGWSLASATTWTVPGGALAVEPGHRVVLAGSIDGPASGFAHAGAAWDEAFRLDPARPLSLRAPGGTVVDAVDPVVAVPFAGSAVERIAPDADPALPSSWVRAPSLITFLPESGEFAGDRGSPGDLPLQVQAAAALALNGAGAVFTLAGPRQLFPFDVPVHAGDLLAFQGDVDRVSGELDVFLSILDPATGEIVHDGIAWDDSFTHDFTIRWEAAQSGTVQVRAEPDFFAAFAPATVTLRAARADTLVLSPAQDLVLEVGDTATITATATCPLADVPPWPLDASGLAFQSDAPGVADAPGGVVTAKAPGHATITVTRAGAGGDLVATRGVTVNAPPLNDTCETALDATGGGVWNASTLGSARDDYTPKGCVGGFLSGPDLAWRLSPAVSTKYRVTATPAGTFNPYLYVLDACPPADPPVCIAGTKFAGAGEPETLEFTVAGGIPAWLVVDGDYTSGLEKGLFTLAVEVLP